MAAPDHRGPPGPVISPVALMQQPWLRSSTTAPSYELRLRAPRPAVHLCRALLSLWATRETITRPPPNVYSGQHRFSCALRIGNRPRTATVAGGKATPAQRAAGTGPRETAMLDSVRTAEHTIGMMTFAYWRGAIARQFAQALADRARAGFRVRLLLDGFGSRLIEQDLLDLVEDAGVDVAWFRQPLYLSPLKQNHGGHLPAGWSERLRGPPRLRGEDLRVPADDDARQGHHRRPDRGIHRLHQLQPSLPGPRRRGHARRGTGSG